MCERFMKYITKLPDLPCRYQVTVPTAKGQGKTKRFIGVELLGDARNWRDVLGASTWGARRWLLILDGKISMATISSHNCGVCVYDTSSFSKPNNRSEQFEYPYTRVEWRQQGEKKASCFFHTQYQSERAAQHVANLFADPIRSRLTGGELRLPQFDFDLS